ncbi:MAG TPA: hypothetical protein VGM03_01095 [Phycisphaerae bacterium]
MRCARAAIGLILCVLARIPAAWAIPPELVEYVPADAVVAVLTDGSGSREGADPTPNLAVLLASRIREMGLIPDGSGATGLFVDIAAALPAVIRHPWAITLLEIASTPSGEGARHLADLRGGLIVLTRGENEELERQIRRALATYTTSEFSKLSERQVGDSTVYELRDSRMPEWALLSWGRVGDAYVVTLGAGSFDRIVASPRGSGHLVRESLLARAEWLARARRECHSTAAAVEWTVDFDGLRRQLENAAPHTVFDRALSAFGLNETDRALWTVGALGREITCYTLARVGDADRFSVVAGPEIRNPLPSQFIPPEASTFAVFDHRPATLLRRLAAGYLATCRDEWRDKLRDNWERLQGRTGVDFQRDVLDQLGDRIVVHTWPPHPLGIALLCTVELEIDGSAERLRRALDVLLGEYGQYLQEGHSAAAGDPFSMRIKRDEDGVWYLQAGIYGPALKVTQHWLVISFAPQAVRQNAAYLARYEAGANAASQPGR